VFRSLAKLQWAISCGLPIDSQLARKAKYGLRKHLRLLLDTLTRQPLIGLGIHLTELYLCKKPIGDTGALGLAKALEVNATLTKLDLSFNEIGDAGAIGLAKALEVNGTLTRLNLNHNRRWSAGLRTVSVSNLGAYSVYVRTTVRSFLSALGNLALGLVDITYQRARALPAGPQALHSWLTAHRSLTDSVISDGLTQ
jgi:hypothetical protein